MSGKTVTKIPRITRKTKGIQATKTIVLDAGMKTITETTKNTDVPKGMDGNLPENETTIKVIVGLEMTIAPIVNKNTIVSTVMITTIKTQIKRPPVQNF